jgi:hypothetical protein
MQTYIIAYMYIHKYIHTYIYTEMAKIMGSFSQISLGKCAQSIATKKGSGDEEETGLNIFTNNFKTFISF